MKGSWLNNPCRGPGDNEDAERDVPDHADLLRRLRANLDKYPGFVNLNAEAATAIETLLAQRAVLVKEVEAWRHHDDVVEDTALPTLRMPGIRAHDRACEAAQRTDAAFPEGLKK